VPETTCCGQVGCGAVVVWARTVRQLDERTRKMTGGRPMMVDWPLPVYRTEAGRLLPGAPGQPVPNLGVKTDQHGTLLARVLSDAEPIRTDERPAVPHWATCKNPPAKHRTRPAQRPKTAPSVGQDALDLGPAVNGPVLRVPGLLSDQSLFPRRRTRRG
jgi:hypothetical protein